MRCLPDELIKLRKYLALIVDKKFRKAHHIHEQDMGDFEMKIGFTFRSHLNSHGERASKDTLANRRPTVERKLRLSNRRGWAEQLAHPHSIRVFFLVLSPWFNGKNKGFPKTKLTFYHTLSVVVLPSQIVFPYQVTLEPTS